MKKEKVIQTNSQRIESLPCSGIKLNVISLREQTQNHQITSGAGLSVSGHGTLRQVVGVAERFPSREDIYGPMIGHR